MTKVPDNLKRFFDSEGRLKTWPGKRAKKNQVLEWFAGLFQPGREYTEKEINAILKENHTFGDTLLLRRELFELGHLNRKKDGSSYWREKVEGQNG